MGMNFGLPTELPPEPDGIGYQPGTASSLALPVSKNWRSVSHCERQVHGYELWKSDGTAAGTVMLDISQKRASSIVSFAGW
jgi:ELWxxDGT repeat protein